MELPRGEPLQTKGKTMDAVQAAKTLIAGLLFINAATVLAVAWGAHNSIIETVSADHAGIFFGIGVAFLLAIPAVCFIRKKA